jgi:polysaccharide export outer membrane protein
MKYLTPTITFILLLVVSCTSQQKLAYLSNLPETGGEETFTMNIPDYKIQPRDILYITVKAITPSGAIVDLLSSALASSGGSNTIYESSQYLLGFDVNTEGNVTIPVVGQLKVSGLTLEEIKILLQQETSKVFKNATVECKLLSFKFTVIGEVNAPGAYINYNNYLTVLEAIGRAGGIGDFGDRTRVLVVRPMDKGTKTYRINIQDKKLLTSEAYFLLPNDVVIVQPLGQKIFNMNLPTISFILSTFTGVLTTTLLLINYFGK